MSWRTVIVSNRAKLDLQLDYLVIRAEQTTKIHLSEIQILIVENTAVSLTAALLSEMSKRKIKIIFCDEKRNPQTELVAYYGSHDTSDKVRRQIRWNEETKGLIWTEIITEKIRKQRDLLRYMGLTNQADLLSEYINAVEFRDSSNREGHAAKVYFNALFGLDFTRTANIPINAALNYGYGILLSSFNREIVSAGYITQLGIFHDNTYNKFNLSSDLMEPYRPLVDFAVHSLRPKELSKEVKLSLVNLLNYSVAIDGALQYVSNSIKIYCKSVFDALTDNDVSELKFYKNELQVYESYSVF